MLLEPVLIFEKTEYVQSNLIVLSDDSQSMDLRDAYVSSGPKPLNFRIGYGYGRIPSNLLLARKRNP